MSVRASANGIALAAAASDANQIFDLSKVPLFRTRLVQLQDRDFRLYLTLHHIIFDGISLSNVFLPELHECYTAYNCGREPALPAPEAQYADFIAWRNAQHRDLEPHLRYWETQLGGNLPELKLPLDRPRPSVRDFRGRAQKFSFSRRTAEQLKEIGRQRGATPYQMYVAAFHVLLYHLTGECDQVIGGVNSSRKHEGVERVLGYLLNAIVLRTRFAPDESFLELVTRVRDTAVDALTHDVPFHELVNRFGKHRKPGLSPIFQVMFSVEPPPATGREWKLSEIDVEKSISNFDLILQLDDREDPMGRFAYTTDIFDAATINRITQEWITLLDIIAARPQDTVASLATALRETEEAERAVFTGRIAAQVWSWMRPKMRRARVKPLQR